MQPRTSLQTRSPRTYVVPSLLALISILATPAMAATTGTGLGAVLPHYEQIRQALATDSLPAIAAPAAALRAGAERMAAELTAESAGVPAAELTQIEALLPEVIAAARSLETAADLETARAAFYALSKPLVRWRQAAGNGPAVVYCSMTERSWLQPGSQEIGNPYLGKGMSTCGQILSK